MSANSLSIDYVDKRTKHAFHIPLSRLKKPENDIEYKAIEKCMDSLIDEVRDNEKHPLALAMAIMGDNLEEYDRCHYLEIGHDVKEVDLVKYVMDNQELTQKDLVDIFGNQGNVSKFLNEKRELSKTQIKAIKARFGISADFFIRP